MFAKLAFAFAALAIIAAISAATASTGANARPLYCSKGPAGWSCR